MDVFESRRARLRFLVLRSGRPSTRARSLRRRRLTPADALRDIARLVAIHQMTVETKFLNDNCVLCGGVAMRFYGSRRFTVTDTDTDTDTSYRLDDWDELDLQAALDIEVEDLTIEAGDPAYWQRKNRLTTAQPVESYPSALARCVRRADAGRSLRACWRTPADEADQAKRHRVWLNCSPLAKPRTVVGVTR